MTARVALATTGLVALTATVFATAQQSPVFRAEADYVEVTARVVDRGGHLVQGLTADDFEIREDRRPVRVETAFQVDLPTPWNNASPMRTVLYRPNLAPQLQVADGRIYLLFLNAIAAEHVVITRNLAHEFVDSYVMPEDVVALWNQGAGLVTFTNDKARLHKALDAFLGTTDTMARGVSGAADAGRLEPGLASALDWFSSVQGRKKSMLLFSAGWAGAGPVFSASATTLSPQTQLVDRADVQIYAVDTRGLVAPVGSAAASPSYDIASAEASFTSDLRSLFSSTTNMRWLAENTGGFAIVNRNEYRDGFKRIVDENSQYYVLGYQSSAPPRQKAAYREISVRVTKPGLADARVQARKGYVAHQR